MSEKFEAEKLSSEEKAELLRRYKETGDKALRNQIVLSYMNIVRYAAVSTRNMYAKYADSEDIINEATIALMAAIDSFSFDKKVKFETYASIRVRGAVIDFIRRQDIVPRNVRRFAKDYDTAYSELFSELNREPTDEEIAAKMGLSIAKFESYSAKAASAQTLSFEELVVNTGFDISDEVSEDGVWAAEASVHHEEKLKYLAKAIAALSDKERLVVTLYYYEKLKFSEIGEVLDVSESRVCQIHSKAVLKMKKSMSEYMDKD
ncbi:MAG: sigma-70 family RNA polymerase sigma factor [Oscillospiraceae bacterium]